MPKVIEHIFTVEGWGRFPIDMLRYDRCVPFDEGQSSLISRDVGNEQHGEAITLRGPKAPTVDRWKSFGFEVLHAEERRIS